MHSSLQVHTRILQAASAARENFDRAERRRLGCVLCSLMRPLRGAPSASVSKFARAVGAAVPCTDSCCCRTIAAHLRQVSCRHG